MKCQSVIDKQAAPPGRSGQEVFDGVLCIAGVDWWYHNRGHSEVRIMCQLAETLPVLFVNSLGMRTPRPGVSTQSGRRIFRKLCSMAKGLRKVAPQMWVFSPIMLPPCSKPWVRRMNARLVAAQIRLVLKAIGMRRWFTWVTIPTAIDVLNALPENLIVFNRSDAFSTFPEVCVEYIKSCEDAMLKKSDLVLYVNRTLMNEDMALEERKRFLGHGVDYDRFVEASRNRNSVPSELAGLQRPIVGFFGSIDDYTTDLKLLKFAAESLPDMSFVLVGMSTLDISDLTSLSNVHYLGFQPHQRIAELGACFDVGIVPRLQNEWVAYSNPIKVKEYLALGIPIVATPIPPAKEYPDLVSVAATHEEFVEALRRAVMLNTDELRLTRQKAVEKDSWRAKAREVLTLAVKLEEQRSMLTQGNGG
jgi:glycosyltransferase involved in cell wall biosynthesis